MLKPLYDSSGNAPVLVMIVQFLFNFLYDLLLSVRFLENMKPLDEDARIYDDLV